MDARQDERERDEEREFSDLVREGASYIAEFVSHDEDAWGDRPRHSPEDVCRGALKMMTGTRHEAACREAFDRHFRPGKRRVISIPASLGARR